MVGERVETKGEEIYVRKAIGRLQQEGVIPLAKRGGPFAATKATQTITSIPGVKGLTYRHSVSDLRERMRNESTIDDVLDTAYNHQGYGAFKAITPMQARDEIRQLLKIVADHEPKTVVEIGTARGGTLYLWCRGIESVDTVVSLDLGYYHPAKARLFETFTTDVELHLLRKDSHKDSTRAAVEDRVDGIDFLFLDGDHTYEGTKQNFELYAPLVADDGLVAFHDIIETENPRVGVPQLWQELKPQYRTVEIQSNTWGKEAKGGIGILYK